MSRNRWILAFVAVAGLAVALAVALSIDTDDRVNMNRGGVAIRGYDTVAYFTEGRPVKGRAEFEHVWHDARWHFASAEHRDRFAADPVRYAPRYGGFCAGAMVRGRKARVDPEAWVIIDDKLYLTYSKQYIEQFIEHHHAQIAEADRHWESLGRTP